MQPDLIMQAMRLAAEQLQAKNFKAAHGQLRPLMPHFKQTQASVIDKLNSARLQHQAALQHG